MQASPLLQKGWQLLLFTVYNILLLLLLLWLITLLVKRAQRQLMPRNDIPSEYRKLPQSAPSMPQLQLNPAHPSIPSRWEKKKIRNMEDYYDGFGSRGERIKHEVKDIPGPGRYEKNISSDESGLLRKSASLSKKGFSNAFVSKSSRLGSMTRSKSSAGPGQYSPKTVDEIYALKKGESFVRTDRGRVPFDDPMKDGLRAGPGQYRTEAQFVPLYIREKPTAAMLSKSKRDSYLSGSGQETPSPLTYSPNKKSVLPDRHTYWSKSKWERFRDLGYDNKVPGPGQYFDDRSNEQREHAVSHRVVGKKYKPKGKQNESRALTVHTFGADTDRFKHSILGRLDVAADTPGPGWYAPLDIIPPEAQAQLTRKANSNPNQMTPSQRQQMMSVFRMTGAQTADLKKPLEQRTPGPAYYYPKKPERKSFAQNVTGKWV